MAITLKAGDNINLGAISLEPVYVPLPAEFQASALIVSPSTCEPGDLVTISALITNIGETAGRYYPTYAVEGVIPEKTFGYLDLAPGASQRVSVAFVAPSPGAYIITVDNQTATLTVTEPILPAEFVLSNLVVSPSTVEEGQTVYATCDVTNIGGETGECDVIMAVVGTTLLWHKRTLIGPGLTTKAGQHFSIPTAGVYTVTANGLSAILTVTEPYIPPPFDPWVYDFDKDHYISTDELLKAGDDRDAGLITEAQLWEVHDLWKNHIRNPAAPPVTEPYIYIPPPVIIGYDEAGNPIYG